MADKPIEQSTSNRGRPPAAGRPDFSGSRNDSLSEGTPRPKRKRSRVALWVTLSTLLVVGILVVMMLMRSGTLPSIEIETQRVFRTTILQTVTATGVIDPETQVNVSPEVSGEIVYIGVKEGDHVRKGQLIVRINPESMIAQRDEAQAVISASQARLAQSQASVLRSEQDLERQKQLAERKLTTLQELEAAETGVKISQAERDAARFNVQQSQAGLRRVRESLNKTSIYAPISGVVTKLHSKVGEKVVGAIQMSGTEIMTIADLSVIEAVVDVSENDVVQVSLSDTAELEVDAIPNQKFRAVVSRIANSPKQSGIGTQEQLTNFEVRVRFIDPDDRFRPGMTATAVIQTDKRENTLAVPIQAVTSREDTTGRDKFGINGESGVHNTQLEKAAEKSDKPVPIVFVRVGDSVQTRAVTTGIRDNRNIEIIGGLKPTDVVVIGTYKAISKDLQNGSRVSEEMSSDKGKPKAPSGGSK